MSILSALNPCLLPSTPLPSGWSVDPVSGHCVRISDGARFGRATSLAIAWSVQDVHERLPAASGITVDAARLRNAIGCAATGNPFDNGVALEQFALMALRAVGNRLVENPPDRWIWQPRDPVDANFNDRLGCFLDAIGVERAQRPALHEPWGTVRLLTGSLGRLAVRCEILVRGATEEVQAKLVAQACDDPVGALERARSWAVAAVREHLTESARVALEFLYRIPFHEHDSACNELAHGIESALACCTKPPDATPPPSNGGHP